MILLAANGTSKDMTDTNKNSDLKIDEEINLEDDLDLGENEQTSKESPLIKLQKPDSSPDKPVSKTKWTMFAGVLLVIAFILNMWFPISFIVFINDIQTATGYTNLKGTILDLNDNPVDNVTVTITGLDLETITDEDGKYYFDQVPVGEQEIHYAKPGYRKVIVHKILFSENLISQTSDDANIIDIPGTLSSGITIDPFQGPTEIKNEKDFNHTLRGRILDNTGSGFNGARVKLDNSKLKTSSDSSGNYILNGVQLGINIINVTKFDSQYFTIMKILFANENVTELDITFDTNANKYIDNTIGKNGHIIGKVSNYDKYKKTKISVELYSQKNNELKYKTTINENGNYSFSNIPVDVYYIRISDLSSVNEIDFLDDTMSDILEPLDPEIRPTIIKNIVVLSEETTLVKEVELEKMDDPKEIKEEISSEYTYLCIIILVFLALLTLAGAISSFQRKRYPLAFMGALVGMFPVVLLFQTYVCGASALSLISLILIVLAREEFEFPKPLKKY